MGSGGGGGGGVLSAKRRGMQSSPQKGEGEPHTCRISANILTCYSYTDTVTSSTK